MGNPIRAAATTSSGGRRRHRVGGRQRTDELARVPCRWLRNWPDGRRPVSSDPFRYAWGCGPRRRLAAQRDAGVLPPPRRPFRWSRLLGLRRLSSVTGAGSFKPSCPFTGTFLTRDRTCSVSSRPARHLAAPTWRSPLTGTLQLASSTTPLFTTCRHNPSCEVLRPARRHLYAEQPHQRRRRRSLSSRAARDCCVLTPVAPALLPKIGPR